jgi:hypothetical protein
VSLNRQTVTSDLQSAKAGGGGCVSATIMLGPDWRVRPLDDLQWVLERRDVSRLDPAGARWRPWAHCRTRTGLETALSRLRADGVVLDPASLAALPDHYDGSPAMPRRALLTSRVCGPSGAGDRRRRARRGSQRDPAGSDPQCPCGPPVRRGPSARPDRITGRGFHCRPATPS